MRIAIGVWVLAALLIAGGVRADERDLTEDASFLRVAIHGRTVRLEGLVVRRADATGRLPVALIAHGKPSTMAAMLDKRADDYVRQARDLARRGWLAVVVMRRGFGASDGPQPMPVTCGRVSLTDRFSADA